MEVREVWRHAHLKQPFGRRYGYRIRQLGDSGLKSTTVAPGARSSGCGRAHQNDAKPKKNRQSTSSHH